MLLGVGWVEFGACFVCVMDYIDRILKFMIETSVQERGTRKERGRGRRGEERVQTRLHFRFRTLRFSLEKATKWKARGTQQAHMQYPFRDVMRCEL